jgi:hypothetical protein
MSKFIYIVSVFIYFCSPAFAECNVKGYGYTWGVDTSLMLYINSGETCALSLLMRDNTVDEMKVLTPPKNVFAGIYNKSAFGYRSKPGFKGSDEFQIRAVGQSPSAKGPIVFTVSVLVQ